MEKIGIIICARYGSCGGGKCFRAVRERRGGFARYAADTPVEVVGFASCGGCPGGNVEYVPAEFLKNGATVVHLATGMVVGYPPCPHIEQFKAFIETRYGLPVVVGTHPVPMNYLRNHQKLPFWKDTGMAASAGPLLQESPEIMAAYD
jgi:predicted metal-binding protein